MLGHDLTKWNTTQKLATNKTAEKNIIFLLFPFRISFLLSKRTVFVSYMDGSDCEWCLKLENGLWNRVQGEKLSYKNTECFLYFFCLKT